MREGIGREWVRLTPSEEEREREREGRLVEAPRELCSLTNV